MKAYVFSMFIMYISNIIYTLIIYNDYELCFGCKKSKEFDNFS